MSDLIDEIRAALPAGYTVEQSLGKGGQGAVFKGARAGASVALKFFAPDPADPGFQRLRREIDLLSTIDCPSLVKLVDFQVVVVAGQSVPMVAYELIDGRNLRAVIDDPRALASGEMVRQIGEQIGIAVEELWLRRVVHRDIKPENVVCSKDGHYVLVDVGFAQHLDLTTMTAPGAQPGTMGYRSPEQCGGRRRLTVHSDVFSLGVTLFETAAKAHPWHRNQAVMGKVPPVPLAKHRSDLDPRLTRLIHEMIQGPAALRPTDPGVRFQQLGGV